MSGIPAETLLLCLVCGVFLGLVFAVLEFLRLLFSLGKIAAAVSHGLIRQYLRNYGVIPIKGLHLFLYLSGFLRIFLFYSFHCINKLLLCRNVK